MKKGKSLITLALAFSMAATSAPINVLAMQDTSNADNAGNPAETIEWNGSDYKLKWNDEFNGTEVDRDAWNVELHEAGWVNSELQEYVDSEDNIQVKDGALNLIPKKVITQVDVQGNILVNPDFSDLNDGNPNGWSETIANWDASVHADATRSIENGAITYNIKDTGDTDWHVQLKQSAITLVPGVTYTAKYKITSDTKRHIKSGVQGDATNKYPTYGAEDYIIGANETMEVSFKVKSDVGFDNAGFYVSMGKIDPDTKTGDDYVDPTSAVITISDFSLEPDEPIKQDVVSYTSGRISTQNKETFTYGLFECRAKVPEGAGYLPAFWLMSNDENIYGQWPRCGEIDCMEVLGTMTDTVYGTIHFGNPKAEQQGTYSLADGESFADDYHTYTCEWKPGEIIWYVDGIEYYKTSDWYSATEGQGTLTYPAPFDQPFYVILNLAVGGSWIGNPDDTTNFDTAYQVDYVRVYQMDEYDENVTKPEAAAPRDPDENGNYINNGNFAKAESLSNKLGEDDGDWQFLTANGGVGSASIDTENGCIDINTEDDGTVDYSIQLVQADVPLIKGATYKLSFDASAAAERDMMVNIKAPKRGWIEYMPAYKANLTTEKKSFETEFVMTSATDPAARLEFNMGATGSKDAIKISNVVLTKIADPDPNAKEEKGVLANGNYIYNGKFQEGDRHLGFWDVAAENATYQVTGFADNRRFKVVADSDKTGKVTLSQDELAFSEGSKYEFMLDADASVASKAVVTIGGVSYPISLEEGQKQYKLEVSDSVSFKNTDVSIAIETTGVVLIDNVMLAESALIKNGSFDNGTTGYEIYVDSSANATSGVDSLKEKNALVVKVNNTSDQDWKIQIKQNNVKLEEGLTYKLKFDAKSTLKRKIRVIMQGDKSKDWAVYSADNIVELTPEYQTFTDVFKMSEATNPEAFLSICLGKIDEEISTTHEVAIDNISLVHVHQIKHVNVVPATLDKAGCSAYDVCEECGELLSDKTSINKIGNVTLSKTKYVYSGSIVKPTVTVKDSKGKTIANTNYTVTYQSGRKNAGRYAVTINFKGKYAGKVVKYFTINKASQKISAKVSAKTYKASTLKKGKKEFTIGAKAKKRLTYSAKSKYIAVSKKGVVTVKKNTPKGIYKVYVKASASANYKAASKVIKITVK